MRVVIQRVSRACVEVGPKVVGQIADGLLVLLGITHGDTEADADKLVENIVKLRIFEDEEGKMNKSVQDVNGSILVVSQFTLYGDAKKGTRPSFIEAAPPNLAIPLYEKCIDLLESTHNVRVETGVFGAMMKVELINDGPVTIILEK